MKRKTLPSLEEWIDSDPRLNEKTTELFESNLPIDQQAREALRYMVKVYGFPLTPIEIDYEKEESDGDSSYTPTSMFEQIAKLRFTDPENTDPRYLVMTAAYLIKYRLDLDMSDELKYYLGNDRLQGLGYRGDDILKAELIPVKKGESWSDLGCRFFTKQVV